MELLWLSAAVSTDSATAVTMGNKTPSMDNKASMVASVDNKASVAASMDNKEVL